MSKFELISIIIGSLNILILIFGLMFAYRQINISRKIHLNTHEWQRRLSTHETLCNYVVKEIFPLRFELLKLANDFECQNCDYNKTINGLGSDQVENINEKIRVILSKFTLVSIQIKNKVLDEDICYLFLAHVVVSLYLWCKPYITEYRNQTKEQHKYLDFTDLAERWSEKMKKKSIVYHKEILKNRGYKEKIIAEI